MEWRLTEKLSKLLEEYADPREGIAGEIAQREKQRRQQLRCALGTVSDNHDPECKGRLRVASDMLGAGTVTPWLPVLHSWSGKGSGIWFIPEIGTQVVMLWTHGEAHNMVVAGYLWDEKHRPPEWDTERAAESVIIQTGHHRFELNDREGKERILIESARGSLYVELGSEGIRMTNTLGGVRVKCRKLTLEGEEGVEIKAERVEIESGGRVVIGTREGTVIESEGNVAVEGKKIKLNGTRGVTAEGKELAGQGSKVMGFDIHRMVIPSGNGTAIAAIPHAFIGELKERLSEDVEINGKKAGVKGSVAKHTDARHLQLPGTIKFEQEPKKEGEVSGNTKRKVEINGKEAAVVGSTVTTCNDIGMRDNSTILAGGMSIPMPMILHPKNSGEYERERQGGEGKKPSFTQVQWGTTRVGEGEEVRLRASVKDIADGNGVTLQVFSEGKSPEDGIAYAKLAQTVEGGVAEGVWSYRANGNDIPPERNPRFIFSAHSAWCPWKKSENSLEVELRRPEITKTEWQDTEGKSIDKATVGAAIKLSAQVKEFEQGQGLTFTVYNERTQEEVTGIGAQVKDGKAEAQWNPVDTRTSDDTGELKYYFEVTAARCKPVKSGDIQVKNPKVISMEWDKKAIYWGDKATLKIKTFELSDESPTCKLQLWEKDYTTEDDFILEQDITIDKDEVEQEIEFNFDVEKILDEEIDGKLEIFCRIIYKGSDIATKTDSMIVVRTERGRR